MEFRVQGFKVQAYHPTLPKADTAPLKGKSAKTAVLQGGPTGLLLRNLMGFRVQGLGFRVLLSPYNGESNGKENGK